ncbi:MAG TPA: ribbon-helix-helix protein, CopG family [Solirubrobacteraceae bacterium]|nr:ribbon-helix-helix protein, CopG family [Solirubrobacteraceae bacterium]
MHMRMHINLDDELVSEIDTLAGSRGRSAFIRDAVAQEVDRRRRWKAFEQAVGAAPDFGSHLPPDWIRQERRSDPRRVG